MHSSSRHLRIHIMETADRVFPSVMHRIHKRQVARIIIIIILIILIINVNVISAKYTQNIHYVPASANPGYIVTTLSSQLNQVSHIEDPSMSKLFFLNGDQLSTKVHMKQYRGQRLAIKVKHLIPDADEWIEQVSVHIQDSDMANQFTNQPYVGFIAENEPVGQRVAGLDQLFEDMSKFSYDCQFLLLGSDSLLFKLHGNYLTSAVSFDYEQKSSFQITIQARCSGQEVAAALTVQVLNVNDNPPVFDQPVYLTAWSHSNDDKLLQVTAVDPDGDRLIYSLFNSSIFWIDPVSGVIRARPEPKQLPETFSTDFEISASDGKHTATATVQVIIQPLMGDLSHGEARRHRRSIRNEIRVVIRHSDTGNLFRVTSVPSGNERFHFVEPAPDGLSDKITLSLMPRCSSCWQVFIPVLS